MSASGPKPLPAIGFLTVLDHPDHGLFGGYLLLNSAGRPLEFHCTAPIKANRAQEILYGPTLEPYLYGEQIGRTLLERAKTKPLVACTDVPAALAVRDFVSLPVVLVTDPGGDEPRHEEPHDNVSADNATDHAAPTFRLDRPHTTVPVPKLPGLVHFRLGPHCLAVASAHAGDQQLTTDRWQPHADSLDLREPFGRIRAAIEEAREGKR